MWNNIGGGLFAFAILALAFAKYTFVMSFLRRDPAFRITSKRAALLAILTGLLGILIMKTLAEPSRTKEFSEFFERLEKEK
jgi:multisubunit Na+/H+ antiporter MnhB subunit